MSIEVNGETMPHVAGETVTELMGRMNYVFPMVVVFVDGKIVSEADFGSTAFPDGARIEIIHLTSGG